MARTRQRIFALTAAIVFLASSVAFSGLVIYQMATQDDQSGMNSTQQAANSSQGRKLENYTPVSNVSALEKTDTTVGTGAEVKEGDTIVVHYTLALAKDGSIVQSSRDSGQPIPLQLASGSVIDGWVQGVPGMKEGGSRRLLIPASLAYKDQSPDPSIPPNSDLVFDIEVVQIQPPQ